MTMSKWRLYVDQYGHAIGASTVAELAQHLGYHPHSVRTMFVDKKDGSTVKCGVIVGRHWLARYKPDEKPAK